jgi:hypothetical protein
LGRLAGARSLEIEETIAGMVPTTIQDFFTQLRLLKAHWESQPSGLDDRLVENMLTGAEAMAAGVGDRPGALRGMRPGGSM